MADIVRAGLLAIGLCLVLVSTAPAQTVAWTKSAYGVNNGDATPFCGTSPRAAFGRAVDSAGNVFITGCAFNGSNNDIITYKVNGATGAVLWSVTYNGSANDDDAGLAVATDASGNAVITGYSRDFIGGLNMRTIKYQGATGAEIWNSSFNDVLPGSLDKGMAVAIDSNGHVVVTGRSQSSVGNTDIRTIKYDGATGLEIWNVKYDGSTTGNVDEGRAIATDSNNDVVVMGTSFTAAGVANMRTIKYSGANGAELWNVGYVSSGDGFAEGNSVAIDSAGNVLVTGTCRSADGGTEICTFKFNGSDGSNLWATSFTDVANGAHAGNAVAIAPGGDVVVTGHSRDTGGFIVVRTIKYNGVYGSPLWTVLRTGVPGDANTLAIDASGNIVIAGYGGTGFRSMSAVKYRGSDGAELWSTPYSFSSGVGGDEALAVAIDSAGNVLMAGKSQDTSYRRNIRTIKLNGATGQESSNTPHPAVIAGALPAPLPFSSKAMGVDSNGDVVVTGYIHDVGAAESIRTIKYSAGAGAELWNVSYKGSSTSLPTNRGNALAIDQSNNVIVTGVSSDAPGGKNMRTIKYAAGTGSEIWNMGYDGSAGNDDEANAVAIDPSGNVLVTGYSSDAAGGRNMRTIKYNGSTGVAMWSSAVYSGAAGLDDAGYSIATDSGGNVFVTGYSKDVGTSINIRTVKYDVNDGRQLWTASFRGPANATGRAFALVVDNAGNPIVAGTSSDGAEFENFRTIKYNGASPGPIGDELWNTPYNGSAGANDVSAGLAIDSSGDVVVTGMSTDVVGGTNTFSIRTIKYRGTTGVMVWTAGYAGLGGIFASGAAVTIDSGKNPIVTGYSTDPAQGTNIRTIKYQGANGAEMLNIAFNGSANADDSGHAVATATGPGNAIYVLGASLEAGKPRAWQIRKIIDDTALGAPGMPAGIPGDRQVTIGFLPPLGDGGSAIISYVVTCSGGFSGTGPASPITVTGLTNDVTYICGVAATNAAGTGPSSATVTVIPTVNPALALVSVQSRKTHGGAGDFNLAVTYPMPITGAVTVEPRAIGAGHKLVFLFNNAVTSSGPVTSNDVNSMPTGSASAVASGNEVVVSLVGVPDNRRVQITFTATGPSGSANAAAALGFLVGDVSETRSVNAADISSVKAHIGEPISPANFKFDIDVSGILNNADVSVVKARSGLVLP